MNTDQLVVTLGSSVTPVRRGLIQRRLALGLMAGGAVTLAMVVLQLGFRPDLATAMRGFAFWMKWTYTLSLGIIAILATAHLARPEARRPRWLWAN